MIIYLRPSDESNGFIWTSLFTRVLRELGTSSFRSHLLARQELLSRVVDSVLSQVSGNAG